MTIIGTFERNGETIIFSDSRLTNLRTCKIEVSNQVKLREHAGVYIGAAGCAYGTYKLAECLTEKPEMLNASDIKEKRFDRINALAEEVRKKINPIKSEFGFLLIVPGHEVITLKYDVIDNYSQTISTAYTNLKNTFVSVGSGGIAAKCLYDAITSLKPKISNKELVSRMYKSIVAHNLDVGGEMQYIAVSRTAQ